MKKKQLSSKKQEFDEMDDEPNEYDYKDPFIVDDRKKTIKKQYNQSQKMELEGGNSDQDMETQLILSEVEELLRTANV